MRFVVEFALVTLIGCGGGHGTPAPTTEPGPEPEPMELHMEAQVVRACDHDCLAWRRTSCEAKQAWTFELDGAAATRVWVTDAGLVRVDAVGLQYVGEDANVWLSCGPQCGAASTCMPGILDFHLLSDARGCRVTATSDTTWEGQAAQDVTATCGDVPWTFQVVPGLRDLRDALLDTGVFDRETIVGALDGMPVRWRSSDEVDVRGIEAAPCSVFDAPAEATRFDHAADFRAMVAQWPEILRAAVAVSEPAMQQAMRDAQGRVGALSRELCGLDAAASDAAVQACAEARPELGPQLASILQQEVEDAVQQATRAALGVQTDEEVTRALYQQPICALFQP